MAACKLVAQHNTECDERCATEGVQAATSWQRMSEDGTTLIR